MLKVKFLGQKQSLENKLLLLPNLCTQAPTIALDYIIASNQFQRVAVIGQPFSLLQPAVSYLPKSVCGKEDQLAMPLQIYVLGDVAILQIRSFARFGRKKTFVQQLIKLLKSWNLAEILMVGCLRASLRPDFQILSNEKRLYHHWIEGKGENPVNSLLRDPKLQPPILPITILKDEDDDIKQLLQTAGIAYLMINLYQKQMQKQKMRQTVTAIFIFGNDIDSKLVGRQLAQRLQETVGAIRKQLGKKVLPSLFQ